MKIKSIHLYSHDGRRRDLPFKDGLNIITGHSSTGKSALAEIIEYCMGSSKFNVPEGVIRDKVAWFAVIYQFPGEQVLVAKPTPAAEVKSCSAAMLRRGNPATIPYFKELAHDTDDDAIVELLSKLLGIPENRTEVDRNHSRTSFAATIKHTVYYLFQKQSIIANKDQLFYRRNEPHLPQMIRDTLPILLGACPDDRYTRKAELREAQRKLKLIIKDLEHAGDAFNPSKGIGLLSEAKAAGLMAPENQPKEPENQPKEPDEIIEALRAASECKPIRTANDDGPRIAQLNDEIRQLRKDRRKVQEQAEATRLFSEHANGFERETLEQKDRLASIHALPRNPATGAWQWPFCEENLGMETPIAQALLQELESLNAEMEIVASQRPQLTAYRTQLDQEIRDVTDKIRRKEAERSAAIAAEEAIAQAETLNMAATRVIGRISYFLENLTPDSERLLLKEECNSLELRVKDLKAKAGDDDDDERLTSILNIISTQASKYIRNFGAEFGDCPAQLDLQRLTVAFDRPEGSTLMNHTGGGENHLAYHLSTVLALHHFAFRHKRPIPQFLMIDQPSQVYFPSEKDYLAAETIPHDMETVRHLFQLLRDFSEKEAPGFQLIVIEHANLNEPWFQDALVEQPWEKPPALVPEKWPDASPPERGGRRLRRL